MCTMLQRLCKIDVVLLSALTFLLGLSMTYFGMYYAGYSLNACRDVDAFAVSMVAAGGEEMDVQQDELTWFRPRLREKSFGKEEAVSLYARKDSTKTPPKSPPTTSASTTKPYITSTSSFTKTIDITVATNSSLPTIFAITPTYTRYTQRVDLTSLCHTLMLVPKLIWIVIEDANNKTKLVTNLLKKCKPVSIVHMNIKVPPPPLPSGRGKKVSLARGVAQRNTALTWIRKHCETAGCRGVVYFMDDDNKYDLQLFDQIRKTRIASVFPVGFAGGLKFEGPICENGKAKSWNVAFAPERSIPLDMAGFAINVNEIVRKPNIVVGKDKDGNIIRRLEPHFLEQFTSRETAECLGGKDVMVWHVKTLIAMEYEKQHRSVPGYIV